MGHIHVDDGGIQLDPDVLLDHLRLKRRCLGLCRILTFPLLNPDDVVTHISVVIMIQMTL
jgi:hypothetical protein